MGKTLLTVRDLHVSFHTYNGTVQAVRGVGFDVSEGETLAVVGESGCGKSVTAQALMRLLPTPPARIDRGSARFNGTDLLLQTERTMRSIRGRDIGMIFQDPMTSLNPTQKIGNQMTEGLQRQRSFSRAKARHEAMDMLELVGIGQPEQRFKQYPHELSGGMRQRVMIALALVCRPKLLIADEPTTALDVTIQAQILELLKEMNERLNTAIIFITHDLGVVAEMCEKMVVMYAGEVAEAGHVADVFARPQHPYTQGLLHSVPRLSQSRDEPLHPIAGSPPDLIRPPQGCAFFARCPYAMEICREAPSPIRERGPNGHRAACWLHHPQAPESTGRRLSGK